MGINNEPVGWQFDSKDLYVPITYEGTIVGLGKPKFAAKVVELMNEETRLRKALRLACIDVLTKSGGDPNEIDKLMRQYLARCERPKYGPRAIAALLRDRQGELDITDEEFVKFCDSYRLSRSALNNIFSGEEISDATLGIIARIVGKSVEELIAVRDGQPSKSER
jgi:hypothetical protein